MLKKQKLINDIISLVLDECQPKSVYSGFTHTTHYRSARLNWMFQMFGLPTMNLRLPKYCAARTANELNMAPTDHWCIGTERAQCKVIFGQDSGVLLHLSVIISHHLAGANKWKLISEWHNDRCPKCYGGWLRWHQLCSISSSSSNQRIRLCSIADHNFVSVCRQLDPIQTSTSDQCISCVYNWPV